MKHVLVPKKLVGKCKKKGREVAKFYKGQANRKFTKGKANTAHLYFYSSMAECAVCIYLGLDPLEVMQWSAEHVDAGYDFIMPDGLRVDVKSSDHPYASRLMWPVEKNDELPQDNFDALVWATVNMKNADEDGQYVKVIGWRTKEYFMQWKKTARAMKGIRDGTLFLDEKDLDPIEYLKQHLNH